MNQGMKKYIVSKNVWRITDLFAVFKKHVLKVTVVALLVDHLLTIVCQANSNILTEHGQVLRTFVINSY